MTAELLPNNELVVVAWLKANVPYLEGNVATSLPGASDANYESWSSKGFVVVNAFGGNMHAELGIRKPVASLTYYAINRTSGKPLWGVAAQLAEQVRDVVVPTGKKLASTRGEYLLTNLGANYKDAKVLNTFWRSEPRRRPGDNGDFAVYTNDIEMHWVVVP